ncbi:hypothetical protein NIES4103_66070 [Nostoc sp. NIES-4103]|nr:hypothetical protein NIES4103_66070 [Nostoc sp. NIES-4103]
MENSEVNELELSLKLTVYFVMGGTKGSNHFMSIKIQLSANIWDGEERFMKLEEQLGERFFKNYEIQLIFDDNSQSKAEL